MDATFPGLRCRDGCMVPDRQSADKWFREFPRCRAGLIDVQELARHWAPECMAGVKPLVELEGFDPAAR